MSAGTFSAHREISNNPHVTVIMSVGHLNGDWQVYACVEFIRRSGIVLRVRPSVKAVRERLVDDLVTCAIAYYNDDATEVHRGKQPSWGIAPDLLFYAMPESVVDKSG